METNSLPEVSQRDDIFTRPRPPGRPFQFDEEVAEVFDDMLSRSIPFYQEVQDVIIDLVARHLPPYGRLYDLGCSTGNTLLAVTSLLNTLSREAQLIGVDQSLPLVRRCRRKLSGQHRCHIIHRNILDLLPNRSHFTILNYTLQFLPLKDRPLLLRRIYEGLEPGGVIFISEKIHSDDAIIRDMMTELYRDFKKRNGYSELEINRKQEALENVLIPVTAEQHLIGLREAGFTHVSEIFRWYNFASFVGVK